jgi:hypothetical protein
LFLNELYQQCDTRNYERKKKEEVREMAKHYITKYVEDGERYAEAWIQINLLGKVFCFWRRRIKI